MERILRNVLKVLLVMVISVSALNLGLVSALEEEVEGLEVVEGLEESSIVEEEIINYDDSVLTSGVVNANGGSTMMHIYGTTTNSLLGVVDISNLYNNGVTSLTNVQLLAAAGMTSNSNISYTATTLKLNRISYYDLSTGTNSVSTGTTYMGSTDGTTYTLPTSGYVVGTSTNFDRVGVIQASVSSENGDSSSRTINDGSYTLQLICDQTKLTLASIDVTKFVVGGKLTLDMANLVHMSTYTTWVGMNTSTIKLLEATYLTTAGGIGGSTSTSYMGSLSGTTWTLPTATTTSWDISIKASITTDLKDKIKSAIAYDVSLRTVTGGSLASSSSSAVAGSTVTVTASPNTGYSLSSATVSGATNVNVSRKFNYVYDAECSGRSSTGMEC